MLIDNKEARYLEDGYNIKTVWDFIKEYSDKGSRQTGRLDIVTGYFTLKALSLLYHEILEEDIFRIVSSELVRPVQPLYRALLHDRYLHRSSQQKLTRHICGS